MEPKILYEDEEVMVIDKPAGVIVDRANTVKAETIQDWLRNNFQFPVSSFAQMRSGIVHRLDKETSGVLLIAKTPEAYAELQRQFKEREIEKTYTALVHGVPEPASGVIRAPIGRLPWNRERFGILPEGRSAETYYKVLKIYTYTLKVEGQKKDEQNGLYSLVEFYPKTGRTHQIRVHAKYIHHPLVADTYYAGRKTSRRDKAWCPRLFLHASKIVFTHPRTKERVIVESKLSEDLKEALSKLQKL